MKGRTFVETGRWGVGWEPQAMVSLSPWDSYLVPEGELVRFQFEAPPIAGKPQVVLSTSGDFSEKKTRITLNPRKGATEVSFRSNTLKNLWKRDDGDNVAYWRVEDAATAKTTVEPSGSRTLLLPPPRS